MPRIDQLDEMLESEPLDVFLNFALAMEYVKAERFDEALSQFARVTEIDPDYCVGYAQHASTFVRMGRKDYAAEWFLLAGEKKKAAALFGETGRYDKAAEAYLISFRNTLVLLNPGLTTIG